MTNRVLRAAKAYADPNRVLRAAKMYAALAGVVITALLGSIPASSQAHAVLVTAGAVATAVATYRIPNRREVGE